MSSHPFQTNRPAWAPAELTLPGAALASALFAAAAFQGLAAEPAGLAAQPNPETTSAGDTGLVPALPASPAAASSGPSLSVTVNLIKQLVELGVLPKEKAANLLQQAENEAAEARAQILAERDSAIQAAVSRTIATLQADPTQEPLPPPRRPQESPTCPRWSGLRSGMKLNGICRAPHAPSIGGPGRSRRNGSSGSN